MDETLDDVDSVVLPKLDDNDSVTDVSLYDSDDCEAEQILTSEERTERVSDYGSLDGELAISRHNQDVTEEAGLTKEKKMDILRKLMKEVNLEDTLNKYRGFREVQNYKNNPSATSLHSEKKKAKMGSEGLRWADRQFMANLEDELEKQYQTDMDKKEDERADLERQRVRRLMVEGIIGPEDMSEGYPRDKITNPSSSGQHPSTRNRKATGANEMRMRSPRRGAWRSQSAPERKTRYQTTPLPSSRSPRPSINNGSKSAKSDSGQRKSKSSSHPHTPRYYTESTFNVDTQVARQTRNCDEDDILSNSSHRCYVHDQEGCSCGSQKPTKRQSFTKKYTDPKVLELAEEHTVDGMYSLAERILPEDRPRPHIEDPDEARERRMIAAAERKRRDLALASRIPRR